MDTEQQAALMRHGYRTDHPPADVSGGPAEVYGSILTGLLRARVCQLDGIEIDGHEGSDLDPMDGTCIHCGEWEP